MRDSRVWRVSRLGLTTTSATSSSTPERRDDEPGEDQQRLGQQRVEGDGDEDGDAPPAAGPRRGARSRPCLVTPFSSARPGRC